MKKIKINPCSKCQSSNIKLHNCGYSSFNVGSAKCQKCKKEVKAYHGSSLYNDWIIAEWNEENPTSKEEIRSVKQQIKKLQKRLIILEKRK